MTTAWYSVWFYNYCDEDWNFANVFPTKNEAQDYANSLKQRGFKLVGVEREEG